MAIITISRDFGSLGDLISQGVAKAKGYAVVDKPLIETILSQYGMVSFGEFYDADHNILDRLNSDKMGHVQMLDKTIQAFAKQDNLIIRGRGGYMALQDYDNVLNVLIKAPFHHRVISTMMTMEIRERKEAERVVEQFDHSRNSFLQTYYGVKADDSAYFDLVIDTRHITAELAINWIIEAADSLDRRQDLKGKRTQSIEVDQVLEATVKKALGHLLK